MRNYRKKLDYAMTLREIAERLSAQERRRVTPEEVNYWIRSAMHKLQEMAAYDPRLIRVAREAGISRMRGRRAA